MSGVSPARTLPQKMATTPASPCGSWRGPVDVAVAQDDRRQAVEALVPAAVGLGAELALPVGGHRPGLGRLGRGHDVGLAVDRAARRRVHHALDAAQPRGLEHVDRADDVDPRVPRRVLDRLAHIDLRGQVEDDVGPRRGEHAAHAPRVADVGLLEAGAPRQRAAEVLALAGGQVVDDRDLVAAIEERVDEVRADEAGAAGDQGTHGGGCYVRSRRACAPDVRCLTLA